MQIDTMASVRLDLYVPTVVMHPVKTVLVKLRPCWVIFWMKSVASKLVWGTARSKTLWRAERLTGTVMLIRFSAVALPAKTASAVRVENCI